MPKKSALTRLRAIRDKVRQAEYASWAEIAKIDREVDELPTKATDAFAGALEERDRQLAELQFEADRRLVFLEESSQRANELQLAADARMEMLTQAWAELQAAQAHIAGLEVESSGLRAQVDVVSQAARERLAALEGTTAAVERLRARLEAVEPSAPPEPVAPSPD
ncbi:MAG TPA: hypothetical protein VIJ12_08200 [Candidatus Baltobacteraceae bacterium]